MPATEEENKPSKTFLKPVEDPIKYVADLRERKKSFETSPTFKPGDVIVWKEGMSNKNIPEYDIPGIVINNFYPALQDHDTEVVSTYYNDILDIQVGFITKENEFIIFAHDSRRFKVYEP